MNRAQYSVMLLGSTYSLRPNLRPRTGVEGSMEPVRPDACERARQWVSQRLDGELSQIESARLDRHLARCTGCAVFARRVEQVAVAVRSLPLARPSHPVSFPAMHGPRLSTSRLLAVGACVAVVVAGVASGLVASGGQPGAGIVDRIQLQPDNGRAELDGSRLAAARARLDRPAPPWSGHGATT